MDEPVKSLREEWERAISDTYSQKLGFSIPECHNESGFLLKPVYDPEDISGVLP